MALDAAFVDAHIQRWASRFSGTDRETWSKYLFHHAPIQNIAAILNTGTLRSRADLQGTHIDVADVGALSTRDIAHGFGRIYFRPRTPTQFRIEGVRKARELHNNIACPTLAMLIFDAKSLLSTPEVKFSNGNMQVRETTFGDTEQFFDTIDFTRVYHIGAFTDPAIKVARCAEVLTPSPFAISPHLRWVYCRSDAERRMLVDGLDEAGQEFVGRIQVSDDLRVFEKKYTYVETISVDKEGIVFSMARRSDDATVLVQAAVRRKADKQIVLRFGPQELSPTPPNGATKWRIAGKLDPNIYEVAIWLESQLAHRSVAIVDDAPF